MQYTTHTRGGESEGKLKNGNLTFQATDKSFIPINDTYAKKYVLFDYKV